jgi:hypothetical protein
LLFVVVGAYTTPRAVTLALPSLTTVPPSVALVWANPTLVGVVTVGAAAGVAAEDALEAAPVPAELVAVTVKV